MNESQSQSGSEEEKRNLEEVLSGSRPGSAHIVNSTGRTNKSAQLTTNQRAEAALRRSTTGIYTGLGCPPDPHQLNNPEDEDRDGLRNVGVYESRTTLPG
jgi:hypothetical protein